jgi:hypothetical protein
MEPNFFAGLEQLLGALVAHWLGAVVAHLGAAVAHW